MLFISTNPTLCLALVAWVALQAAVLFLPEHFGPSLLGPSPSEPDAPIGGVYREPDTAGPSHRP